MLQNGGWGWLCRCFAENPLSAKFCHKECLGLLTVNILWCLVSWLCGFALARAPSGVVPSNSRRRSFDEILGAGTYAYLR